MTSGMLAPREPSRVREPCFEWCCRGGVDQQTGDRGSPRGNIGNRKERGRVTANLAQRRNVGCHNDRSTRESLDHWQPEPLGFTGDQYCCGFPVKLRKLLARQPAHLRDGGFNPEARDLFL